MDFQPITYTVDKVVSLARSGRLALPDFQREFVWGPHKVVELLDSVSRGWPVGSLLLLKGPQPFKARRIDAGPSLHSEVDQFVLDGQQRITALYHAVADVSDTAYFIDFNALRRGDPEYIIWKRRSVVDKELGSSESRAAKGLALVKEVADNELFYKWQSRLSSDLAREMLQLREEQLFGLKSKVYRLPVIELEHEIELEALARIFETINRTGVKLNAFDLMVAVLYPHAFNLRDSWEDAVVDFRDLKEFGTDGIEILKLIAIWARRRQHLEKSKVTVRGVRQGDVLAVPPKDVKANWSRAVRSYARALAYLRDELGVVNNSIAPPQAMILAASAFLDVVEESAIPEGRLKSWYWANIILQSYSQGANTRVISDVDRAARSGSEMVSPNIASILAPAIFEPIRRNKILVNGIAGALVLDGALDVVDGRALADAGAEPIVGRSIWSLCEGDVRANENAIVSDIVFAKERSFSLMAAEVRRGARLEDVFSFRGLKSQFVYSIEGSSSSGDRSNQLRELLESRLVEALGGG